jgi:hypothetical protein
VSGPAAVKTKSAGLTNVTSLSKVKFEVRLPPVTDVFASIVTPLVALVTMLPTCIVPTGVPIVTLPPIAIIPEVLEIAVPSFKSKSAFASTATL